MKKLDSEGKRIRPFSNTPEAIQAREAVMAQKVPIGGPIAWRQRSDPDSDDSDEVKEGDDGTTLADDIQEVVNNYKESNRKVRNDTIRRWGQGRGGSSGSTDNNEEKGGEEEMTIEVMDDKFDGIVVPTQGMCHQTRDGKSGFYATLLRDLRQRRGPKAEPKLEEEDVETRLALASEFEVDYDEDFGDVSIHSLKSRSSTDQDTKK